MTGCGKRTGRRSDEGAANLADSGVAGGTAVRLQPGGQSRGDMGDPVSHGILYKVRGDIFSLYIGGGRCADFEREEE